MIELFWIKSLLNFVVICLSGLTLSILINQKENSVIRLYAPPVMLLLGIHLIGFMRFTSWINDLTPVIDRLYDFHIVLNLAIGPVLLARTNIHHSLRIKLAHGLPVVLGGLDVGLNLLPETPLLVISQIHLIAYLIYLLVNRPKFSLSLRGWKIFRIVLICWLAGYLLHLFELMLWAQFEIVNESMAWVLYIMSETILAGSFLYLVYNLASGTSGFSTKPQSQLPAEVLSQLEKEFAGYIKQTEVFTDPLISQQKVARQLNVSPHHISRYLNHHYGDNFLNVINSQRIEASKLLLRDPEKMHMTIQEIFYEVGFNSKSTFITAFKNATGMTPSEFRSGVEMSEY